MFSALQGPAWGRKPSPNRPGQAGPCWWLHGSFGLACLLKKPKPSRQAVAFCEEYTCEYLIIYFFKFILLLILLTIFSVVVTHITHCLCHVTPHFSFPFPPSTLPSTTNGLSMPENCQTPTGGNADDGWWKGLTKNTSKDMFLAVGKTFSVFDYILIFLDTQC